jgi:S-adenosylmethionine:tRNA ribosyltransferase-isomerase
MRVDLFDFNLPPERIAAAPAVPRDSARMLHVGNDGLTDRVVRDLPHVLRPGDVLVVNDTRVIPARLDGRRGDVKIELLLHRHIGGGTWSAFAKPGKRLKVGQEITFDADLRAIVQAKTADGLVEVAFNVDRAGLIALLDRIGHMPLPPYIRRPDTAADRDAYQTVYAAQAGAVAAPTAGLHFTPALLSALTAAGIARATVTLHVGAGTFLPVKVDDTADHVMHAEWGEITPAAADTIAAARQSGGRVVAVGTTSLRLLESAAGADGSLAPFAGETSLFITPGFRFKAVDLLLTNFHLPRSTLFMLVSAFSGLARMRAAYEHAIAAGYRFYSYGDACLLERDT